MYRIEVSTYDIVGTFRSLHIDSAPKELCSPAPLVTPLLYMYEMCISGSKLQITP